MDSSHICASAIRLLKQLLNFYELFGGKPKCPKVLFDPDEVACVGHLLILLLTALVENLKLEDSRICTLIKLVQLLLGEVAQH